MSRPDILDMFRSIARVAELTFVEYERDWGQGIDRRVYEPLGRLLTWEESVSADRLLDDVNPDRLVLLFNSSLNQVALRVAARDREIETVHVEHGYRLPVADAPPVRTASHRPQGHRLGDRRTHSFFVRSFARRRARSAAMLARYAGAVGRHGATPGVLSAFADLRRPERYISYSRECFEHHRDVDRVPDRVAAATVFTGVPQFDDFRIIEAEPPRSEALLLDHQFHNARLFGWNERFRREWVAGTAEAVFKSGFDRLHVKPHPGDRSDAWAPYTSEGTVRIVERPELPKLAEKVSLVLGTFSTMQLPFAAMPHIVMISLEIHPEHGWFPSRRLADAGVVQPVRSHRDLAEHLRDVEALRARQRPAKHDFVARFLERLDGQATSRLAHALVSGPGR